MNEHPHALVDAHFAATSSPGQERRMRRHLLDCGPCRRYYRQRAVVARLDPRAPSDRDRMGRALGLRRPRPGFAVLVAGVGALAAAGLLLFAASGHDAFTPRGAGVRPVDLAVYAVSGDSVRPAAGRVRPGEELAFGYRNPSGKSYLMVCAVDTAGRIYWYHPAWTDPAANPRAVPIAATERIVELPEAIAHPLAGDVQLVGLFLDEPRTVREVEAALQREAVGELSGVTVVRRALAVVTNP